MTEEITSPCSIGPLPCELNLYMAAADIATSVADTVSPMPLPETQEQAYAPLPQCQTLSPALQSGYVTCLNCDQSGIADAISTLADILGRIEDDIAGHINAGIDACSHCHSLAKGQCQCSLDECQAVVSKMQGKILRQVQSVVGEMLVYASRVGVYPRSPQQIEQGEMNHASGSTSESSVVSALPGVETGVQDGSTGGIAVNIGIPTIGSPPIMGSVPSGGENREWRTGEPSAENGHVRIPNLTWQLLQKQCCGDALSASIANGIIQAVTALIVHLPQTITIEQIEEWSAQIEAWIQSIIPQQRKYGTKPAMSKVQQKAKQLTEPVPVREAPFLLDGVEPYDTAVPGWEIL